MDIRALSETIYFRLPTPTKHLIKRIRWCLRTPPSMDLIKRIRWCLRTPPSMEGLASQMVTIEQMQSDIFSYWADCLKHPIVLHRKLWEWVYALQALSETGVLAPGNSGLGFGVGDEPIGTLMVNHGCRIVLTNQSEEKARAEGWTEENGQYVADPSNILRFNREGLSDSQTFKEKVSYRNVDMNFIPEDLRGFDFVWSLCAMEHLGSLANGIAFVHNSLKCLKPGGIAVHTTEFNLSSDRDTVEHGRTVLYRRRDLVKLATNLVNQGHLVDLNFHPGDLELNSHIDTPPYSSIHSKIYVDGYVTTSFGLIIHKKIS